MKLIMGIHQKFWHASELDIKKVLRKSGYDVSVVRLVAPTVRACNQCADWKRQMPKPQVKASFSEHFNQRVQTDLFFLLGKQFVILVDKCTRYCVAEPLDNNTPDKWMRAVFRAWIRYCGPPV